MVLGDESSDFVAALINVNPEICGRFAERHGLAYGTFSELSQLPEIRAEIAGAIREVNRRLEARAPGSPRSRPCPRSSTPTRPS